MSLRHISRPRPWVGTVVFLSFVCGAAASRATAAEPPAYVLPAAMLLIALLSESSAGALLIPPLVAAAGFAVQPRVNVGALPLLLILFPALFTMASAGMSRAAELRRCLKASAGRGNNILFYLSAAGSLISAYLLLK